MKRFLALAAMASILGLGFWSATAWTGPPRSAVTEKLAKQLNIAHRATPVLESEMDSRKVYHILSKPTPVNQFPANATIADALQFIQDQWHVQCVIETTLFKEDPDLNEKFPDGIFGQKVSLPGMTAVPLGRYLRLMFAPVDGTFLVRKGAIFIVPKKFVTSGRVLCQPVDAVFEQIPLSTALAKLADQTGATIVLDNLPGERKATDIPVTATFSEVSVKTAVRLLANIADLRMVRVGNALYVTTNKKAQALLAEINGVPTKSEVKIKAPVVRVQEKPKPSGR
jgi:hypothetical protein